MILTEANIQEIVKKAVSSLLLELEMGVIGGAGPIKETDMEDPMQMFSKEIKIADKIKEKKASNRNFKADLPQIFGETPAYKIWQNYYKAMMSKPGKKALGFLSWLNFVCYGKKGQKLLSFSVDGSYLFGYWINNFFLACYFAPSSPIGMAKVIRAICQFNNIIFAVTQDLSSMLIRLGIPKADKTHDAPWRGRMVTKDIFGTSQKAIEMGFRILDFSTGKTIDGLNGAEDNVVKDITAKYAKMSPTQKAKFKKELGQILQQKYPSLLSKFKV